MTREERRRRKEIAMMSTARLRNDESIAALENERAWMVIRGRLVFHLRYSEARARR